MKNKLFKKNFFWHTLGSFTFGFTSLIYLIIVKRINGLEEAGVFTYCFSLAAIMCAIGTYSGKTYQVTETNDKFKDIDYIYTRIFTCIIMILSSTVIGFIFRFNSKKFLVLLFLTLYRSIDAFAEVFHAILQRNEKLYIVGKSLFFKTVLLIVIFFIVDKLTKNILLSSISLVIINLLVLILYDYNISRKYFRLEKVKINNMVSLLKTGFSMFAYCFLSNYIINIPKYIIDGIYTDEIQGIYGIIIIPASFLALVSQYITQPFLNDITNKVKNNNYVGLKKITIKLILSILGIGVLAFICCYLIGIPFLEFIYGLNLSNEKISLLIVILGSICYSIVIFLSAILVAMRKINIQTISQILVSIIALIVSHILIKKYVIIGATLSYLIIMLLLLLLYLYIVLKKFKKGSKENEKI